MGRFFESTELDEILHDYPAFLREAGRLLDRAGWTYDNSWDQYGGLVFFNEDDSFCVVFGNGDENPYAGTWGFYHTDKDQIDEGKDLKSLRAALEKQGFTI